MSFLRPKRSAPAPETSEETTLQALKQLTRRLSVMPSAPVTLPGRSSAGGGSWTGQRLQRAATHFGIIPSTGVKVP